MAGNKLSKSETDQRVAKCYELRYEQNASIKFREWIVYCEENYSDKSPQQYGQYWTNAGEMYQESWREKLNKQIDPAVNSLIELLTSDDEKIRQKAIDQIFKYTGNDIQKLDIQGKLDINVNFGDEK